MSWKGMLRRIFRIFLSVFFVWFLINLTTQSHVNWYGEKDKHFHNDFRRAREAIRRVYSLQNLTMVPPEVAMKIGNIWKDELSKCTLDDSRTMTDQIIQAGGQPERLLLVSKWKSGSSYFGAVLRSRPGTHYFFEPLHNVYGHLAYQVPDVALKILRNVFQCQNLEQHALRLFSDLCYFSRNSDLMAVVRENRLEWDTNLLTVMCRLSPILAAKVVLLRLRHVEALLEDEKLNIKVIFLLRDPRATMNSRLNDPWCLRRPECRNVSRLCTTLVDDYYVARKFERKYPRRFMQLRYEDLLTRSESSKELLRQLNISSTLDGIMGESQLTKWIRGIGKDVDLLRHIQNACAEAMDLWGYVPLSSLPTNLSNILKSSVN